MVENWDADIIRLIALVDALHHRILICERTFITDPRKEMLHLRDRCNEILKELKLSKKERENV